MSIHSKKLKYWTNALPKRFKFGACDPVLCKAAYFIPVVIHGACAVLRVSVVPRELMLLIGKDTHDLTSKTILIFPGAGYFQGNVLRDSRAGHLMVPLLPDSS